MRRALARRLGALAAVLLVALAATGCSARVGVDVEIDRDGVGRMDLALAMDANAQTALGLTGTLPPEQVVPVLFPFLAGEPGWTGAAFGGEGANFAVSRDDLGGMTIRTRHAITSLNDLRTLLTTDRSVAELLRRNPTPDVPTEAPALNALRLTLGSGTGDNPGFDLFARGGVGELDQIPCSGDELLNQGGNAAFLRRGLSFEYRFSLPGGPGSTNADEIEGGRTALWQMRYGDCDTLEASSGGGSSSTLINGLILAALSGFILIVLGLRAFRRRRARAV